MDPWPTVPAGLAPQRHPTQMDPPFDTKEHSNNTPARRHREVLERRLFNRAPYQNSLDSGEFLPARCVYMPPEIWGHEFRNG